jgi:hypothetical protein
MEDRTEAAPEVRGSRRDVVKKMAYAAPIVLSLAITPAFASAGSSCPKHGSTSGGSGSRKSLNN